MSVISKDEVRAIINAATLRHELNPRKLSIYERIEPSFRLINHPRLLNIIRKLKK